MQSGDDEYDDNVSECSLLIPDVVKPANIPNDKEENILSKSKAFEVLDSWSMDYIGLYFQYAIMAVFSGSLAAMNYPIFANLIGLRSYEVAGAANIISLWWSLKVFFGAFSDAIPIYGYRRKPYIIGGWILCICMTCATIMLGNPKYHSAAWPWILCFSSMTFSFLIADVAADSMLADLAQREPLEKRGQIQSNIYIIRQLTSGVIGSIMAFTFNDKKYGGNFSWGFTVTQYLKYIGLLPIIAMYPFWRLHEEGGATRKPYCAQFNKLFERIKLNAVWRVILFAFLVHFFTFVSNATAYDIERQWCHVEPLTDGLFSRILGNSLVALGIYITKTFFLNTSWRKILAVVIVYMVITSYVTSLMIDFGVIRSQYFYVGAPLVNSMASGIFFVTTSYCAVELAEPGSEGIMFGLITTIGNLTIPFASLVSANIASLFDLYDEVGILKDDLSTRRSMAILDTVVVLINLLSLPTLLLLPSQKKEIQDMLKSGASNANWGKFVVSSLIFFFVWTMGGNILQIFQETACLPIVGGGGC